MLSKAGLNVIGLDVSVVGLRQIAGKEPWLAPRLACCDFLDYAGGPFRYLISMQAFQHGTRSTAEAYFQKTAHVLVPGGILFLRVNSSDTDVLHQHRVTEESGGGFTVLYEGGPKRGQNQDSGKTGRRTKYDSKRQAAPDYVQAQHSRLGQKTDLPAVRQAQEHHARLVAVQPMRQGGPFKVMWRRVPRLQKNAM